MANKIKWNDKMDSYLKLNIDKGYESCALHLGVTQMACKK